jgi:putative DNA primase/helicase
MRNSAAAAANDGARRHVPHSNAPPWRSELVEGDHGPRDCVANVCSVLRLDRAFAGKVAYNELRERVVAGSLPWHKISGQRDWEDRDDVALAEWCQRQGIPVKPSTVAQAVQHVAAARRFNPLRDRLDGLKWDNVKRLDSWLTVYLGVPATRYSAAVGRAWPISAVARAYDPGCKVDHALILRGGFHIDRGLRWPDCPDRHAHPHLWPLATGRGRRWTSGSWT